MDERNVQRYLLAEDVQERIRQNIQRSRVEATVTIGRAASLFGFSESKLRDLETSGHLSPLRSKDSKGQRQYSLNELVKLAVIRELLNARYTTSEIPQEIDTIWYALQAMHDEPAELPSADARDDDTVYRHSITQRLQNAREKLMWRYFVSHALRLSLMLIRENVPNTMAGLVLPLHMRLSPHMVVGVEGLPEVGEAVVGWLSRSGSSQTMLTIAPSFQREDSYYRVLRLQSMREAIPEEPPVDSTLILIDRRIHDLPLTLTRPVVETIRQLISPIYKEVGLTRTSFGMGMNDVLDPSTDLDSSMPYRDMILNGLAEMIVRLGGTSREDVEQHLRWRFSCILLPNTPTLSMQQHSLIVRAQSKQSPHKEGVTTLSPQGPDIGICIKAYQSGHVIYLPDISDVDTTIALRDLEGPLRSAIAVPIEGTNGIAIAVLYVVSDWPNAFSLRDQRVLRLMTRMIGECIETYAIRLRTLDGLSDLIDSPTVVDPLFKEFLPETEFIRDIEQLLIRIQTRGEEGEIAFIAIDVDNQSGFANKHGDLVSRKLSRLVGMRIQRQLRAFKDDANYRLYHVYADRFYILLDGMTLEQAQAKAELLRQALKGVYHVDPLHTTTNQIILPEAMIRLQDVTARLGVSGYLYSKLIEIMQRCYSGRPDIETRIQIMSFLEEELDMGKREGGNVVIAWERKSRRFKQLPPFEALDRNRG